MAEYYTRKAGSKSGNKDTRDSSKDAEEGKLIDA
jgi:hypothetical protein